MLRQIEAPDKEWLTEVEASAWLNIKPGNFSTLVAKGVIPEGRRFTSRCTRWHWEVIVGVSLRMKFGAFAEVEDDTDAPKPEKPKK